MGVLALSPHPGRENENQERFESLNISVKSHFNRVMICWSVFNVMDCSQRSNRNRGDAMMHSFFEN